MFQMKCCCMIFPNTFLGSLAVAVFGMIANVAGVIACTGLIVKTDDVRALFEKHTTKTLDNQFPNITDMMKIYISISVAHFILDFILFICVKKKESGRFYLVLWCLAHLAYIVYLLVDQIMIIEKNWSHERYHFDYIFGAVVLVYAIVQIYFFWCVASQFVTINKIANTPEPKPEEPEEEIWVLKKKVDPQADVDKK